MRNHRTPRDRQGDRRAPVQTATPTVIVPLDGTRPALAALPVAREFAAVQRATLRIVHVTATALPPPALLEKLGLTMEAFQDSILDQPSGAPAAAVLRIVESSLSSTIVMCMHTDAAKPSGELGSIAEALLRQAPCPVVLVHPERGSAPWTLHRLLVPHDGTPTTAAAIGPSFDLAAQAHAQVIVLHVAGPETGPGMESGSFRGPRYVDQPQHEWPAWAEEFLGRLSGAAGRMPPTDIRVCMCHGEAGEEILRWARAEGADLIVLAWRGRFEAQRAATLKRVIRAAPCPVLVLRVSVKSGTRTTRVGMAAQEPDV